MLPTTLCADMNVKHQLVVKACCNDQNKWPRTNAKCSKTSKNQHKFKSESNSNVKFVNNR